MNSKLTYGIDFGTTNTSIALCHSNKVIEIPIDAFAPDPTILRSVIYINPDKNFYFGQNAIDLYLSSVKNNRSIEYKTQATGRYVKVLNSNNSYEIVAEVADVEVNPNGRLLQSLKSALSNQSVKRFNLFGDFFTIEDAIGKFLSEVKRRADEFIGTNINSVLIGRPIEYVGNNNKLALERMTKALKIAGFTDIKFQYEPIAAANDYNLTTHKKQNVLVFDFGGGTLDISILKFPNKEILSNIGVKIGGDSFNSEIFNSKMALYFGSNIIYGFSKQSLPRYIFNSLESWYGISLLKNKEFLTSFESFGFMCSDKKALHNLKSLVFNNLGFNLYESIERSKKELTFKKSSLLNFKSNDFSITTKIEEKEFEKMIEPKLFEVKNALVQAIKKADIKVSNVDKVITTGGSSLTPSVQKLLNNFFGAEKIEHFNTFKSVASGLAKMSAS